MQLTTHPHLTLRLKKEYSHTLLPLYAFVACYRVTPITYLCPRIPPQTRRYSDYTMGWTVRRWNPGGYEILRIRPDLPWEPPSLLYNGYWVLPEIKRPVRVTDHTPSSSAEVKKEQSYTSTSPLVLLGLFEGDLNLYLLPYKITQ